MGIVFGNGTLTASERQSDFKSDHPAPPKRGAIRSPSFLSLHDTGLPQAFPHVFVSAIREVVKVSGDVAPHIRQCVDFKQRKDRVTLLLCLISDVLKNQRKPR
jgi:hypothetical protein